MSVQSLPQNVFKKVAVSERKNIFRELPQHQISMYVKYNDKLYIFVAKDNSDDKILWLDYTEQSSGAQIADEAVLNFNLKEDRYFMTSQFVSEKNRIGVRCDQDLFVLQRRANTRVDLPADYPSQFNIIAINDRPAFIEMKVEDFSAGGMRLLETRDPISVKVGDVIKGTLKMSAKSPLNLEAEVRFVGERIIQEASKVVTGVEFQNIDKMLEGRLMTMVTSLQQDVLNYKK